MVDAVCNRNQVLNCEHGHCCVTADAANYGRCGSQSQFDVVAAEMLRPHHMTRSAF